MDDLIQIGKNVVTANNEVGKIVSAESGIQVSIDGKIKDFTVDALLNGKLKYLDQEVQDYVEAAQKKFREDEEAKKKKQEECHAKACERAKEEIAELKRRRERRNERNRNLHLRQSRVINRNPRPYIASRRENGKPCIFMVCQFKNYQVESRDGYIWAPLHNPDTDSRDNPSHLELEFVKTGDVVFHHFNNTIFAVSIASSDCIKKAATKGHGADGKVGRCVELSYHQLNIPADTSLLKIEKIKYGSQKYGPFDKYGKNKRGNYLSELADEMARCFLDAAISSNPGDTYLNFIKPLI